MRGKLMSQKGFTIWFTGLSGAGKTTLARMIESRLMGRGMRVEVLDGDIIRTNLSRGLGFSKEDRDTNIRRIGFVCNLLSRNDVVAIAAAISPYREIRDELREQIGAFVEVYAHCPLDVLAERDVKGLYKKALAGEIKHFTGVDDPYEEPFSPEVIVNTDVELPEQSAAKIMARLEDLGLLNRAPSEGYTEEDEEEVRRRLESLGYV
jgi:adenylylsulfate kinase